MLEQLLNNDFLISVLAFALILIPAIIIHELGHFLAAKWIGINVLEFGLGFPPRMVRLFRWGETDFTLNWLPIGAFVRPFGEDIVSGEDDPYEDDYDDEYEGDKAKHSPYITEREELIARGIPEDELMSVNDAKPIPRIIFMAAGATFNVISAILIFMVAAFLGYPVEIGARVQLAEIPEQSVFNQSAVSTGDAIERINGELFPTSEAFFDEFTALSGQNVTLDMRRLEDDTPYSIDVTPTASSVRGFVLITVVMEDEPGHIAGLEAGDRVVGVDGETISAVDPVGDLIRQTNASAGEALTLNIERPLDESKGFTTLDIQVTPREINPDEGRIGIGILSQFRTDDSVVYQDANPQIEYVPQSAGFSVQYGFARTWETLQLIASVPSRIIDGTLTPEESRPVSVVGISQIGGEFLKGSIRNGTPFLVLEFFALISIFLGITNLLPIPALDGGRIVFVIVEIIRGERVPPRIENVVHQVAIIILILLSIVLIFFDIINPIQLP